MNNNFFWQIYDDICAIVSLFQLGFLLLSLARYGNTGEWLPLVVTIASIPMVWLITSWIRRNG